MALQTALVVDDSKLARITLQRLLEKHHLKVQTADSARDALTIIAMKKPDIIFMDHLMPEMDGFEATKAIKANSATAHIPIIMCTGKEGVDNYDEQARAIGASGTLSKPPQSDALAAVLKEAGDVAGTVERAAAEKPTESVTMVPAPRVFQSELDQQTLDRIIARVQSALADQQTAEAAPAKLSPEAVDTLRNELQDSLKSDLHAELMSDLQSSLRPSLLTELTASMEASMSAEITQRVRSELETTMADSSQQPTDGAAETAEAMSARMVAEVEQTLRPMLDSEIEAVEQRVQRAMDETLSEWRKDLDQQMNSIAEERTSESASKDAALEGRMATWQDRLDQALLELNARQTEIHQTNDSLEGSRNVESTGETLDEAAIEALISEKVAIAAGDLHQQDNQHSGRSGGGAALAIAGIVIAIVALVKSFGVF